MKKITQIIPEYEYCLTGTSYYPPKIVCEWAYILDTKTLEVTKVKVKVDYLNK
jgi:hypothetical protein